MTPFTYISTEPRESGMHMRPDEIKRFNRIYPLNPASSYIIPLYSENQIQSLLLEISRLGLRIQQLELGLGGLLLDFDDGVNGGASERVPSLDYARTICKAIEFKKEKARKLAEALKHA